MIPMRAVSAKGNQKVVNVVRQAQSVPTLVATGLSNDTFIEITSGLMEGDQVTLNTTTTSQGGGPEGSGMQLLGGGPGGGPPGGGPPP